jgi:preprotein translocase subunit SecD
MSQSIIRSLILIIVVVVAAVYLVLPNTAGIPGLGREIKTYLGLDLIGGIQVLLEADLADASQITQESMSTARQIIENRVNGLGVSEAVVQLAGERRIVVELPGVENPEQAVQTIKGTALLEWVDLGLTPLPDGTVIQTDYDLAAAQPVTGTQSITPTAATGPIYRTVMTGSDIREVGVTTDQLNRPAIGFELTDRGRDIFGEYTTNNVGSYLAIVLDKTVISAPQVQSAITEGSGIIEGNFDIESANALAIQLRYGSLPIPLKVVETRTIGPTLGQDSLQKSLVAGVIGLTIVLLFMMLYYRLPGIAAALSILIYGVITFALFRTIPVTLTLAGIAGLMLSTGSALDANILIFERLKEELRAKKSLRLALELAWKRAWPSIRDSNFATLITCAILFWFGSSFGATIVKGFAVTLAIGVGVSLFCALLVTRTLLNTILSFFQPANFERWFGL